MVKEFGKTVKVDKKLTMSHLNEIHFTKDFQKLQKQLFKLENIILCDILSIYPSLTFVVVYIRICLVDENSESSEFSHASGFVLNGPSEVGAFVSPEGSAVANTLTIFQWTNVLHFITQVVVRDQLNSESI